MTMETRDLNTGQWGIFLYQDTFWHDVSVTQLKDALKHVFRKVLYRQLSINTHNIEVIKTFCHVMSDTPGDPNFKNFPQNQINLNILILNLYEVK